MAAVAVAFDTLKAATRLQEAGFDETKARERMTVRLGGAIAAAVAVLVAVDKLL